MQGDCAGTRTVVLVLDSVPRVTEAVGVSEAGEALYLLSLGSDEMQSPVVIRDNGIAVWRKVDGERSVRLIAEEIAAAEGVDAFSIVDDVLAFLNAMADVGLIADTS